MCDETLILVFSGLSDARDLIRCAATCRRWRRLVSSDAPFICRRGPPRCDRFVRRLALGAFLRGSHGGHGGFVPFLPAPLSVASLVDQGAVLDTSRVVASRNGRVVLDLRRRKSACVLRLCVCNPMTGEADFLPPLAGKDSPGAYACALLTADDELHLYDGSITSTFKKRSTASYRVLLIFNHRTYTALRRYSTDDAGGWGPEVKVTGARIARGRRLGMQAAHATLVRGGEVCWHGLGIGLKLATLQTSTPPYSVQGFESPSRAGNTVVSKVVDRLLGVMPDGGLCVLERRGYDDTVHAYVVRYGYGGVSGKKVLLWTLRAAQMGLRAVRLRWFCERSGVVLFTARRIADEGGAGKTQVYALDVQTKEVGRVDWPGDQNGEDMDVCGYEMDQVAMLAELDRSTDLHLLAR
ncbi:hypothetical protein QYE76_001051 [Lolium multiflorum]|uniref:F-box domain-containing protein n=1 Tax=Lolium multiflorum TaxID=4521 RepID=A0AAD8RIR7_LOLMU|nr:hypothetical protein QYE76_001051 [Lolium multiflorum]